MTDRLTLLAQAIHDDLLARVPGLIVATLAIVGLLVAAHLTQLALRVLLTRIGIDALAARTGLDGVLRRIGIRQPMRLVLPRVAHALLLLFLRSAAGAFGWLAVADTIDALAAYLPNVVAALLLVIAGTWLSQAVGTVVRRAAEESGIEFARPLGTLTSWLLSFLVIVMAIGQLKFETEIVRVVASCALGGLALAFGLSVGLGTRDITRNVLAGFYARKVFRPGDALVVRGERGVLRAITPVHTLIEREGRLVVVANSVILDDVVQQ